MASQELSIRNGRELAQPETGGSMGLPEIMAYAEMFFKSGLFSDTAQAAQAAVKILAGQELGMGPFQAMQSIHIIKGKATLAAGAMATLIKGSRKYDYRISEKTPDICRIEFFQLSGSGQYESLGESAFTVADARRQGTQNMEKFPANMLFNRAMSNGAKWFCPDIFGGPVYTPEEMGATVNGDTGEVITLPDVPPLSLPAPKTQRTATNTATIASRLRNALRKVWQKADITLTAGAACVALSIEPGDDTADELDPETLDDSQICRLIRYGMTGRSDGEVPAPETILAEAKVFLS